MNSNVFSRFVIALGLVWSLTACMQSSGPEVLRHLQLAEQQKTCLEFESHLWNASHEFLDQDSSWPSAKVFAHLNLSQNDQFRTLVDDFYRIVFSARPEGMPAKEWLSALELGARETKTQNQIQDSLQSWRLKWKSISNEEMDFCDQPSAGVLSELRPESFLSAPQKVLSVMYQSCQKGFLDPLDENAVNVEGIKIIGVHADGIGNRRIVDDLVQVQRTHPYIDRQFSRSCYRVDQTPPIYDYGGKPFTTNSNSSTIDFFKDAGSGTSALGVDCSGLVFSFIAFSGWRLHPQRVLKANLVHGIPARFYLDPEKNGMPCFEPISFGAVNTLQVADLIVSQGHIAWIDSLGEDPFGLRSAGNKSQCDLITEQNFDFTIAQSSPVLGGIGSHRSHIRPYLATNPLWKERLIEAARRSCHAYWDKTHLQLKLPQFQIVRHKKTKECLTRPLSFEKSHCVASCL